MSEIFDQVVVEGGHSKSPVLVNPVQYKVIKRLVPNYLPTHVPWTGTIYFPISTREKYEALCHFLPLSLPGSGTLKRTTKMPLNLM